MFNCYAVYVLFFVYLADVNRTIGLQIYILRVYVVVNVTMFLF